MSYAEIQPTIVEVNPLTKAELPTKEYRKVPIAIVNSEQVNGSDAIVDVLLQNHTVEETILAKSPTLKDWDAFTGPSQAWVEFANNDLAALIYPNICATLGDSYAAFGYVNEVDTFSMMQKVSIRTIGSLAMYMAASRIKAKRGITDEHAALQSALDTFQHSALGTNDFVSGTMDPNLGDLAVYGTLRSVQGLKAHTNVMNDPNNVALKEWYLRVQERLLPY